MAFISAYILLTLTVGFIAYVFMTYLKNRRFWKLVSEIKGEDTLPIIGNTHQVGRNSEAVLQWFVRVFHKVNHTTFKIMVGNSPYIILCNPETIEVVLSSNKEIEKNKDYTFFSEWLGDGLVLSTGNKWRKHRKILTPAFHFKILEKFISIFDEKGKVLIEKLATNKGEVFAVNPFVTLYALDVICDAAMGVNVNAQEDSESDYVKAVYSECNLFMRRSFSLLKRIGFIYPFMSDCKQHRSNIKILHSMTNNVIQSRKLQMKDQIERAMNKEYSALDVDDVYFGKKKVAFLDMLLLSKTPDGKPLSDQVIREETDTFMFAGHDTISSAISFALYELANNPDVQKKAFKEVRSIIGDDPSTPVTYKDLQAMKYMEMVIKETLRLYPSVPVFGRNLENDMELPDGKIIPAGCGAMVFSFLLGRNPRNFKNPEKFNPERFLPENLENKHPFSFVSFSAGPRNCIGQKFAMLELKSILSKILRNFELHPGGPETELRLMLEVILKSKSGQQIKISDRKYD